ncbi:MAG TPA: glycoside hydrolase family 104 protein [Chitinophaga sp.]|uniref:glycoside hydrolase family 24 protein n=1 Tax=Chitinophaga sp. TaxID=1869181 RepID=UPI002C060A9C|nr:glycoside hydrolase family 104 protein [Chitinophaga sp.]HVI45237.1 glycoside hydrolase family 104 protein [Chitinophaga sp.]
MSWQRLACGLLLVSPLLLLHRKKKRNIAMADTSSSTTNIVNANIRAFLIMLQHSEGTYGPDAYKKLYGGGLMFSSYANHPNTAIRKWGITSTAAGAYQFLYGTWNTLKKQLSLPDFSPKSQDRAALELIRMKGALPDIAAGRIAMAIQKCRKIWASLPGAGYGQNTRSLSELLMVYQQNGGQLVG